MSCPELMDPETESALASLASSLAAWRVPGALRSADDRLQAIRRAAVSASRVGIAHSAAVMSDLLQIVCCALDQDDAALLTEVQPIVGTVEACVADLAASLADAPAAALRLAEQLGAAQQRWACYLELLPAEPPAGSSESGDRWAESPFDLESEVPPRDAAFPEPDGAAGETHLDAVHDQIRLLLAAVAAPEDDPPLRRAAPAPAVPEQSALQRECPASVVAAALPATVAPAAAAPSVAVDPELLEAYLDDAQRCLAGMEQAALVFEAAPHNQQPLRQLCRELHTLKGASASIGLAELASRLHALEDQLQAAGQPGAPAPAPLDVLAQIDGIRQSVAWLAAGKSPSHQANDTTNASSCSPRPDSETPPELTEQPLVADESLRVKAAQIDRLMDMLAELVMLRNRRDSRAEQLKAIHSQVLQCRTRLRLSGSGDHGRSVAAPPAAAAGAAGEDTVADVAGQLAEIGRALRDLFEPLAEENRAISRFIGQFRQELMELRRVPVAGLFRRLERSVREAARAEQRSVRLRVNGEHTGIERSLQERLYEPLLHIVRNAVSHGIEPEADRLSTGKERTGTITLEARGGTNLVVVTVQDDGRGLNYDALRRRGHELGFLSPDQPASRDELAQLMFRPGFSTRQSANQISGRGVGMDVVATTLERMHGWVEVESTPGRGTQIRLMIPRRSVIEHAMLFRAAGRMFALPMQSVREIGSREASRAGDVPDVELAAGLGLAACGRQLSSQRLVLTSTATDGSDPGPSSRRLVLRVDEIVGPQEVVVRPLPQLLARHLYLSGVSLSASGELVLLLDSRRLVRYLQQRAASQPGGAETHAGGLGLARPMLVVDDSLTARRRLIQGLRRLGNDVAEASDGQAGLEALRAGDFAALWVDLEMPRLNGLELIEQVRQDERLQGLPVVMVTTRTDEEYRARASQLGAVAYLVKPVSDAQLEDTCQLLAGIR